MLEKNDGKFLRFASLGVQMACKRKAALSLYHETVNNMESITARFDRLMAELETGEGAASKLIYDAEVYANMKKATENLNRLLLDIKYNPNKYLHVSMFGSRTRYTEEEIQAIEEAMEDSNPEK